MPKRLSNAVIFATIALTGCASNPDIPTYSGEVRAVLAEKATEAGTFIHSKLSTPMPAWDAAPAPVAPINISAPDRGTLTQSEMSMSAPAVPDTRTVSGVELYAVDTDGKDSSRTPNSGAPVKISK